MRSEIVYKLQVTHLELQDEILQWGQWTQKESSNIFKITETSTRPYEFPDNIHMSVTLELETDLIHVDRQVYSLLDWLGDVGGLGDALFWMGKVFIIFYHFRQFDFWLLDKLYKVKTKPKTTTIDRSLSGQVTSLQKISSARLFI